MEEKVIYVGELEKANLWLQKEIKEEAETHLGAAQIAGEIAEEKFLAEIEKSKTELNSKSETLLQFIGMLAREKVQNEKLGITITEQEESLREINEKLARAIQKNEELEKQLCKKRGKFGKLGGKIKVKVWQLAERVKSQVQELVAQIEVKVK